MVAYGNVLAVLLLVPQPQFLLDQRGGVGGGTRHSCVARGPQARPKIRHLPPDCLTAFLSVTVFALKEFGVLPHTLWTRFAMPVGSIVQLVLLSIALADHINQLKKESSKAREEQLRVSQLNERMVKEQNQVLESR